MNQLIALGKLDGSTDMVFFLNVCSTMQTFEQYNVICGIFSECVYRTFAYF